jgi:cyanate lyase
VHQRSAYKHHLLSHNIISNKNNIIITIGYSNIQALAWLLHFMWLSVWKWFLNESSVLVNNFRDNIFNISLNIKVKFAKEFIMTRNEVTELIILKKMVKQLSWPQLAEAIGMSKEWTTAALLGQMTLTADQATTIGALLDLPADAISQLQVVPYKGSLSTTVPTDPLIYRFYELVNVYGTTFKALIHEEFGDGIMSAIDFNMDLKRESDPNGDRVNIVMSGKFLPYKSY